VQADERVVVPIAIIALGARLGRVRRKEKKEGRGGGLLRETRHTRAHAESGSAYRFGEEQIALRLGTNARADAGTKVPFALARACLLQGWERACRGRCACRGRWVQCLCRSPESAHRL
jgi:hypothetical protein